METRFVEGQKVKIVIASDDDMAKPIRIFNGKIAEIETVERKRIKGGSQAYYTLKDIKSPKGLPYYFVADWLVSV